MKIEREDLNSLFVGPMEYTRHRQLPDPAEIRIYDTTLRDGEQMPGVAMSPEDKYIIARELSEIGCHILDLGFPSVSAGELAALRLVLQGKVKREIRDDLEVVVMCRANQEDIDTTIRTIANAGFSPGDVTFLIFTSGSMLHCKHKIGSVLLKREGLRADEDVPLEFFHQANMRLVSDVLRYAKSRGIERIEFGAEDSSRTPLPQVIELARVAIEAGAMRYIFADTTGSLTPDATEYYCRALKREFPGIPLGSHFHNDFDLATANVVSGVLNGLTVFSSTVNGIGERAGNAPLHSVVTCLKYLYGLEIPNFRYERLWRLRSLVEKITGIAVQAHEPVVGYNVYSHESGIHTHGVSIARIMYEPIPYEEVGGTARMVFGKHSGAHGVIHTLARHEGDLGGPVDRELVQDLLVEIKAMREIGARSDKAAKAVSGHYQSLQSLGISEEELVGLAKRFIRERSQARKQPA